MRDGDEAVHQGQRDGERRRLDQVPHQGELFSHFFSYILVNNLSLSTIINCQQCLFPRCAFRKQQQRGMGLWAISQVRTWNSDNLFFALVSRDSQFLDHSYQWSEYDGCMKNEVQCLKRRSFRWWVRARKPSSFSSWGCRPWPNRTSNGTRT